MRKYVCHKTVEAAKIESIKDDPRTPVLMLEGGLVASVPPAWITRHQPEVGGYLVRYEDGYLSFSPARAFENGYTLVEGQG